MEDVDQKEYSALRELAEWKGIELEYADIRGQIHGLSKDTLRIFFRSLGLDLETPEDVEEALRRERDSPWRQLTKPVWVEYQSDLPEEINFQFPLPETLPPDPLFQLLRIELSIEEEGGYQRIQNFESEAVRIKETPAPRGGVIPEGRDSLSPGIAPGDSSLLPFCGPPGKPSGSRISPSFFVRNGLTCRRSWQRAENGPGCWRPCTACAPLATGESGISVI